MTSRSTFSLLLAALTGAWTLSLAAPRAHAQPDTIDAEPSIDALAALEGDLRPEQRKAIRDAHDEARKVIVKARAEIEVATIDLRRELDLDRPDERKVAALIGRISLLEGQARTARIVAWVRVKSRLTPEQRSRLATGDREIAHARREREALEAERRLAELERAEARLEADRAALKHERAELERSSSDDYPGESSFDRLWRLHLDSARLDNELEPPGTGEVLIESPVPATVVIDGKEVGETPFHAVVPAGVHKLELRWPNGTKRWKILVAAGRHHTIEIGGQDLPH
jgi:Spy/CpxP family protein refolding chaperone